MQQSWTETDLAYFAGILDGEGCLAITKAIKRGYPAFHTRVSVINSDARLIRWIHERFGGAVCLRRKPSPHSNPNANPDRWKPTWEWKCSDKAVAAFLPAVTPYLVAKQDQAMLLMEYRQTVLLKGDRKKPLSADVIQQRDELKARLSLLNKKGA